MPRLLPSAALLIGTAEVLRHLDVYVKVSYMARMTKSQFNEALRKLGLSVYASPRVLNVTLRQAQRYASGEQAVEVRVATLLELLQDQVRRLKMRRHQLKMMISSIDDREVRILANNKDETASWRAQLDVWLKEIEDLLRNHPSGLPPQIPMDSAT